MNALTLFPMSLAMQTITLFLWHPMLSRGRPPLVANDGRGATGPEAWAAWSNFMLQTCSAALSAALSALHLVSKFSSSWSRLWPLQRPGIRHHLTVTRREIIFSFVALVEPYSEDAVRGKIFMKLFKLYHKKQKIKRET